MTPEEMRAQLERERLDVRELAEAFARWGDNPVLREINLSMTRREAWVVMSLLQLATRHPGVDSANRRIAQGAGRRLQQDVCDTARLFELAERGWNPSQDVAP